MYLPDIELHETTSLEDAAAAMGRYAPEARFLAGGTDLLVDLKMGRISMNHVVSIKRIEALQGLNEATGRLRIGALTTITQLDQSPIIRKRFSSLLDAASKMAAQQIRNVATVGGNIACAVPCADLPPILTAMKASVLLWSPNGEREVPLADFFTGPRETIRRNSEVLTATLIPSPPPRFGAAYARFGLRDGNTIAVAAVAASLQLSDSGDIEDARIVLGAVAPVPKSVEPASGILVGQKPDADVFRQAADAAMQAAEPISDVRGSADFRRELVGVLTRRALDTAHARAQEVQ